MTALRCLSLALLMALLSACEPKVEPARIEVQKPTASEVEAPSPPIAEAPTALALPAAAPRAPVASVKPAAAPAKAADEPAPSVRLDLSLPPEWAKPLPTGHSETEVALAPLLPPLFEPKPATVSPFQLSGRLITNDGDEDYWKSLDGAEVQFEFKR